MRSRILHCFQKATLDIIEVWSTTEPYRAFLLILRIVPGRFWKDPYPPTSYSCCTYCEHRSKWDCWRSGGRSPFPLSLILYFSKLCWQCFDGAYPSSQPDSLLSASLLQLSLLLCTLPRWLFPWAQLLHYLNLASIKIKLRINLYLYINKNKTKILWYFDIWILKQIMAKSWNSKIRWFNLDLKKSRYSNQYFSWKKLHYVRFWFFSKNT